MTSAPNAAPATSKVKILARYLVGPKTMGMIDYCRHPIRGQGSPFNGQRLRRQLFERLMQVIEPAAILETGTNLGTTTEFIAKAGVPVYTIEADARRYGAARMRLRRSRNVTVRHGDSRQALNALYAGPLRRYGRGAVFAYLDAHLDEDLPLAEEIDIIFKGSPDAVVMIDDFAVPGDPGFGYDEYGPGKILNAEYISPAVTSHGLAVFYPGWRSQDETGERRGCVVLCKNPALAGKLESEPLLRRA